MRAVLPGLTRARKLLESAGQGVVFFTCPRTVFRKRTLVGRHGPVTLLANVAGVVNMQSEDEVTGLTEEAWDTVIDTDLKGVWLGMKHAIPSMVGAGGGNVVNISSLAALKGMLNLASYSAAKAGVIGLTQQAAYSYAESNVRVNAVAPGPIWTPLNPMGGAPKEKVEHFGESTPMGRAGEPNEVAPCFLFLACEDSSYMSGQVLHPNGGTVVNG